MKRSGPAPNAESVSLGSDTCRRIQTEQLADTLACESSVMALVQFFQTLDRWAREADAKAEGLADNPNVAAAIRHEAAVSQNDSSSCNHAAEQSIRNLPEHDSHSDNRSNVQ